MFFVTIILCILGTIFVIWGKRAHSKETKMLGVCFFLAAIGTGVIEYFALSIM